MIMVILNGDHADNGDYGDYGDNGNGEIWLRHSYPQMWSDYVVKEVNSLYHLHRKDSK